MQVFNKPKSRFLPSGHAIRLPFRYSANLIGFVLWGPLSITQKGYYGSTDDQAMVGSRELSMARLRAPTSTEPGSRIFPPEPPAGWSPRTFHYPAEVAVAMAWTHRGARSSCMSGLPRRLKSRQADASLEGCRVFILAPWPWPLFAPLLPILTS